MPLAFTQEDFLVLFSFEPIKSSVKSVTLDMIWFILTDNNEIIRVFPKCFQH